MVGVFLLEVVLTTFLAILRSGFGNLPADKQVLLNYSSKNNVGRWIALENPDKGNSFGKKSKFQSFVWQVEENSNHGVISSGARIVFMMLPYTGAFLFSPLHYFYSMQ